MAKRKGNGSAEGHRNAADMNNPGPERAGSAKEHKVGGPNVPGQGNSGSPEHGNFGPSNSATGANGKKIQKKDIAKAYEKYSE